MKTIVLGSNGLVGSALKKQLGDNHVFHTRKDADLLNYDEVDNFFKLNQDCECVINCSALVGGVQANMNNNKQFFEHNYKINKNVLEAAYKYDIKNLVSILSTCIFPDKDVTFPLTANQIDNGAPHFSNYGYSYAKRLLGYETSMYKNLTNNNWISVILTNVYGEEDQFNLSCSHLIPALIHKAFLAKKNNTDLIIWGDGTPLRQFLYSEDAAKSILWAINNWNNNVPVITVDEKEHSIKSVVDIIAKKFDISPESIKYDSEKPNGQYRKPAKSDIKNFDFISLEDGINKTIDWFIHNYETLRK